MSSRSPAVAAAFALALALASSGAAAPPPLRGPAAVAEGKRLHEEVHRLVDAGQYEGAQPLAERELELREASRGPKHADVAEALNDLAEVAAYRADFARAEPLYERALAIREKTPGKESAEMAETLDDLGVLYVSTSRLEKAEAAFSRALAIREKVLGKEHKLVASTLQNLAALYFYQGDVAKAEPAFLRALAATEKALGKDATQVATVASNLAALYDQMGRGDAAEPLHLRALAIREKALGPEHPLVAFSLSNLGVLMLQRGEPVRATELLERALAIREKALGPEHPDVAVTLSNLGSAWEDRGDKAKAEELYRRALGIFDKRLGPTHRHSIQTLHNLALLLAYSKGDEAVPFLQRLIEARSAELRAHDARAADSVIAIAQLAMQAKMLSEARELSTLVIEAVTAKYGPNHPYVAQALAVLAEADERGGDLSSASKGYARTLEAFEKAYGKEHPQTARVLMKAARVAARLGDLGGSAELVARAADIDERAMRIVVGAGSEAQKKAYVASSAKHTDDVVSIQAELAPRDPRATRLALLAILRRKGRALDALADGVGALRKRLSPEDASLLDSLAEMRALVAGGMLRPPKDVAEQLVVAVAEKQAEELERTISDRSAAFRADGKPITVEAVEARLPKDAALVEIFMRHPRELGAPKDPPPRYVAYVLRPGVEPSWLDLGEAAPIDADVGKLRVALSNPSSKDAGALGRALDERLMRPVRKLLGNARRLFVSPDGAVALLPLGALRDEDGRYLVETTSITYLTSGRDLLRDAGSAPKSGDVVVANPAFGERAATPPAGGALARAVFAPLPGTAEEARALGGLLPSAALLTGEAATEEAIEALHAPRILHVATHGFFLGASAHGARRARGLELDDAPAGARPAPLANPLLSSGLALAGANAQKSSGKGDGVLTALEASGLDLWGTKLVVLSACETGVGVIEAGDGVAGLRRALVMAGAESTVMSLWKVDDEATRDLMIDYYRRLTGGGGRSESLRQAQLSLLGSPARAHPYYWASFIPSGDDHTLDGRAPAIALPPPPPGRVPPGARGCGCGVASEPEGSGAALLAVAAILLRRRRRCLKKE